MDCGVLPVWKYRKAEVIVKEVEETKARRTLVSAPHIREWGEG
ncbi:hypothetical protein ACG2F4_17500 [Halalkalibaculum sp. DA3122]